MTTYRPSHAGSDHLADCIDACLACHRLCTEMVHVHCLVAGGAHAAPAHIAAMTDCADMCRAAADFLIRGSSVHAPVCSLCAELCAICSRSCRAITDGTMDACADACDHCQETCESVAHLVA